MRCDSSMMMTSMDTQHSAECAWMVAAVMRAQQRPQRLEVMGGQKHGVDVLDGHFGAGVLLKPLSFAAQRLAWAALDALAQRQVEFKRLVREWVDAQIDVKGLRPGDGAP